MPKQKTLYIVKIGRTWKAVNVVFDDIQEATEFFATLTKKPLRVLSAAKSKAKKGEEQKMALFFGGNHGVSIETRHADIYESKEDALAATATTDAEIEDDSE